MSEEKFDLFNQPPTSQYEAYSRNLRSGAYRQIMSQTNDDDRSMMSQTDEIVLQDASMHFPDDIGSSSSNSRSQGNTTRRMMSFLRAAAQVNNYFEMFLNLLNVCNRPVKYYAKRIFYPMN